MVGISRTLFEHLEKLVRTAEAGGQLWPRPIALISEKVPTAFFPLAGNQHACNGQQKHRDAEALQNEPNHYLMTPR